MIDKVTSVRRTHIGYRVGQLDDSDMVRVSHALIVFLGLASPSGLRERPGQPEEN